MHCRARGQQLRTGGRRRCQGKICPRSFSDGGDIVVPRKEERAITSAFNVIINAVSSLWLLHRAVVCRRTTLVESSGWQHGTAESRALLWGCCAEAELLTVPQGSAQGVKGFLGAISGLSGADSLLPGLWFFSTLLPLLGRRDWPSGRSTFNAMVTLIVLTMGNVSAVTWVPGTYKASCSPNRHHGECSMS